VAAAEEFTLTGKRRRQLSIPFAPLLVDPNELGSAGDFGGLLTAINFDQAVSIARPFNKDLEALGTLYLDDYQQALDDIWGNRLYALEERTIGEAYPPKSPVQHRIQFPGYTMSNSLSKERYPYLYAVEEQAKLIRVRRKQAVPRALRGSL